MKNILVVIGHPNGESFCGALAREYASGAESAGATVTLLEAGKLQFDLNLKGGYGKEQALEADLVRSQELIRLADHLVFVYPSWWASMPALLKGFIDRVFLPGFAFKYRKDSPFPEKLLMNKSARLLITMDAPGWYYIWFNRAPGLRLLKFATLEFCGVSPVKYNLFGKMRGASPERLKGYFEVARKLGIQDGK